MSKRLSTSELVAKANKRFCHPGFMHARLLARGEPAIYLSEDKKFIITDYPDGTTKKKRLKKSVPLKSEKVDRLPEGSA